MKGVPKNQAKLIFAGKCSYSIVKRATEDFVGVLFDVLIKSRVGKMSTGLACLFCINLPWCLSCRKIQVHAENIFWCLLRNYAELTNG